MIRKLITLLCSFCLLLSGLNVQVFAEEETEQTEFTETETEEVSPEEQSSGISENENEKETNTELDTDTQLTEDETENGSQAEVTEQDEETSEESAELIEEVIIDKEIIEAPAESVSFNELNVPDTVSEPEFEVSGKISGSEQVSLYINNEYIKSADVESDGTWNTALTLENPKEYCVYAVRAEAVGSDREYREERYVRYVTSADASMTSLVMKYLNNGKILSVDLMEDEATMADIVYQTGSEFNFEIEFDEPQNVEDVYVVSTKGGESKTLEAFLNEETGKYETSGYFDEEDFSYEPGEITVEFSPRETPPLIGTDVEDNEQVNNLIEMTNAGVVKDGITTNNVQTYTEGNATVYEGTIDYSSMVKEGNKAAVKTIIKAYDNMTGSEFADLIGTGETILDLTKKYLVPGLSEDYVFCKDYSDPGEAVILIGKIAKDGTDILSSVIEMKMEYIIDDPAKYKELFDYSSAQSDVATAAGLALDTYKIYRDTNELLEYIESCDDITDKDKARSEALKLGEDRVVFGIATTVMSAVFVSAGGAMAAPALLAGAFLGSMKILSNGIYEARAKKIKSDTYVPSVKINQEDFDFHINGNEAEIWFYRGHSEYVAIPSIVRWNKKNYPVSKIYSTFLNKAFLKKVVIPNSIKTISIYTFSNCTGLTEITIPDSVEAIENSAFSGCTGLTKITIPDKVETIGNSAFSGCTNLEYINIPESVTSIKKDAFSGCEKLKTIGPLASLSNVEIDVTELRSDVFNTYDRDSNRYFPTFPYAERLVIPEGVTSIEKNSFNNYSSLKSITIPSSVTTIEAGAFSGCTSLTEISIPGTVETIGEYAFSGCTGLKRVTVSDGVANIEKGAFNSCTGISGIIIPNSVTSIGDSAFQNCTNLTDITIPDSAVQNWKHIFDSDNIKNITISDNVTHIEHSVFSGCASLTSVVLSNSITSIWGGAFSHNPKLTTIVLPDSLDTIEWSVFYGCTGLESIEIPGSVTTIGETAFKNCSNLKNVILHNGLQTIERAAFENCTSLQTMSLPESVTNIEREAFMYCSDLRSIELSAGLTKVSSHILRFCDSLEEIIIPEGITLIGSCAFADCPSLQSLTLPNSIAIIDDYAFFKSDNLRTIYYDGTEEEWNEIYYDDTDEDSEPYWKTADDFPDSITVICLRSTDEFSIIEGTALEMPTASTTKLTVRSSGTDNVIWSSSNEKAAVVDADGTVSAKTYGKTTITAVSESDPKLKATCEIQTRFYDVNDSSQSYYKPVYWGADNGVVAGFNSGEYFGPDENCTRAQFVTFLWRLAGKPAGTKDVSFPDVDPKANYFRAVKWAVSQGIIVGFKHENASATFEPDGVVTRGQVATMLWRFGGKKTAKTGANFKDVKSTDSIYRAVSWGQEAGFIKGYKSGEFTGQFRPDDSCLRQHIVTFLYRYARDVLKRKV